MELAARLVSITTTVESIEHARAMARALVGCRLAACVQIEPGIVSIYRWDGSIQEENEVRLVIKTTRAQEPALSQWMAENHPYELPQYTVTPVEASEAYAAWVAKETGS